MTMVVATEDCVMIERETSQVLKAWSPWTFPENMFWGFYKPSRKEDVSKEFLSRNLDIYMFLHI